MVAAMSPVACTIAFDEGDAILEAARWGRLVSVLGGDAESARMSAAPIDPGARSPVGASRDRKASDDAHRVSAVPGEKIGSWEMRPRLEELHKESFAWAVTCARGDEAEATDVLQTAYVKVLNGEARFDGRSSLRTWFFGVLRRTAQERRRRSLLAGRILVDLARRWAHQASVPPVQQIWIETTERTRNLRAALEKLTERQRQVLSLVFEHDMTVDEAASTLGIAPGSARTHYDRGKQRLRILLNGEA